MSVRLEGLYLQFDDFLSFLQDEIRSAPDAFDFSADRVCQDILANERCLLYQTFCLSMFSSLIHPIVSVQLISKLKSECDT